MKKLDPAQNVYKCTYAVMHGGKPIIVNRIVISDKKPYQISEEIEKETGCNVSPQDVEILNDKYTDIYIL